eukprot:948398-Amphidinium_carterae.2
MVRVGGQCPWIRAVSLNQCPQSELFNTRTNCLSWNVPVYNSILMGRAQTLSDTFASYTSRTVCDLEP